MREESRLEPDFAGGSFLVDTNTMQNLAADASHASSKETRQEDGGGARGVCHSRPSMSFLRFDSALLVVFRHVSRHTWCAMLFSIIFNYRDGYVYHLERDNNVDKL